MMERASTMRSKILGSLPKAASPVTFQISSPLSPVRVASRKGYPSLGISIIPQEVRRKPKNSSFDQREPGSPKVSCMGQVKNRKNKKKNKGKRKPVLHPEEDTPPPSSAKEVEEKKKKQPVLKKGSFKGGKGDRLDVTEDYKARVVESAPSSSHTRKYGGNCGGVLERFDWRTCGGRGEEQVEKVIIPCPAGRVVGEMKLFKGEKHGDRVDTNEGHKPRVVERVPSLNQMKKYASSRGSVLEKFDCTIRDVQAKRVIIPRSAKRASDEIKIFNGSKEGDIFDVTDGYKSGCVEAVPVPYLNQMKQYASSRGGVLNKFDWRMCEGRGEEQVENVIIPCSGRVVVGGEVEVEVAVEARKEVNVWKRRNKSPPPPTHVNI